MERLDDMPPLAEQPAEQPAPSTPPSTAAPAPAVRHNVGRREPYRPTPGDFARAVAIVALAAITLGMHEVFRARVDVAPVVVWLAAAVVSIGTGAAASRILNGRCVGFVPTMIICCTAGITLAAIAYGVGEHVARWLT